MNEIPIHDFHIMRGDGLPFRVRYSPGGVPMDWTSGASVTIVVRTESGVVIEIPGTSISLIAPGDLADADAPNISADLLPEDTLRLDDGQHNLYQIRIEDEGMPLTALTGRINSQFSPIEGS